jgi:hypothetical protein
MSAWLHIVVVGRSVVIAGQGAVRAEPIPSALDLLTGAYIEAHLEAHRTMLGAAWTVVAGVASVTGERNISNSRLMQVRVFSNVSQVAKDDAVERVEPRAALFEAAAERPRLMVMSDGNLSRLSRNFHWFVRVVVKLKVL